MSLPQPRDPNNPRVFIALEHSDPRIRELGRWIASGLKEIGFTNHDVLDQAIAKPTPEKIRTLIEESYAFIAIFNDSTPKADRAPGHKPTLSTWVLIETGQAIALDVPIPIFLVENQLYKIAKKDSGSEAEELLNDIIKPVSGDYVVFDVDELTDDRNHKEIAARVVLVVRNSLQRIRLRLDQLE